MTFLGYTSPIEFDPAERLFVGRILDIADMIGFQGATEAELEQAFREAVADYLHVCPKIGKLPDRSGPAWIFDEPRLYGDADVIRPAG